MSLTKTLNIFVDSEVFGWHECTASDRLKFQLDFGLNDFLMIYPLAINFFFLLFVRDVPMILKIVQLYVKEATTNVSCFALNVRNTRTGAHSHTHIHRHTRARKVREEQKPHFSARSKIRDIIHRLMLFISLDQIATLFRICFFPKIILKI